MANLEQLPSGSFRYRKQIDGKKICVIFDHKPSNTEIKYAETEALNHAEAPVPRNSMKKCAEAYIDTKRNVLSPSTIRGYGTIIRTFSKEFQKTDISKLNQVSIQAEISRYAKDHAPKTTANFASFIMSVLDMFRPELMVKITLPQKVKKEPYIPTDEDVRRIMAELEGTMFEVAFRLACLGLRRSEIAALTLQDLDGDIIHINKTMQLDEANKWVISKTKTYESTRDIPIGQDLADKIRQQGYIYKGNLHSISKHLVMVEDKLGIPHFTIHKLRHYFVTKLSESNIPEADILRLGGYSSDRVMKSVYRHSTLRDMSSKREAIDKVQSVFSDLS